MFDGQAGRPYVESDATAPRNVYGASKVEAERAVLARHDRALVVRTAAFFGPWDDWNFVSRALAELVHGREVAAADDLVVSPTFVPDLVHTSLDLLLDGERGIWHLANAGGVTWAGLARLAAEAAGIDASAIAPRPHTELGFIAARPARVALGSQRGWLMPSLDDALGRYVRDRPWERLLHAESRARETPAA